MMGVADEDKHGNDGNAIVTAESEPARTDIDSFPGVQIVEFGALWCGHCQRARPLVDAVLIHHPAVRLLRIEDGPGRRLGRSFRVKFWPTLVFLRRGVEVVRLVRPTEACEIEQAMAQLLQAED